MDYCHDVHSQKEPYPGKAEVETLLHDILTGVIYDCVDGVYAYFLTKDWLKLKKRIQKVLDGG